MGWHDLVSHARRRAPPWVRHRVDRSRACWHWRRCEFRVGPPREGHRLRVPRRARDDCSGQAIVKAYYGNGPRLSYWNGCSTGGRQGLKEAQRYPADYDGILAGAPANYMTHLSTQSLWVAHATLKDPASYIPREKYAVIHKAVLDACDGLDGVKDAVLEDPMRCHFDPKVLQCSGADTAACLTAPQVEAARVIYGPAKNPRTGAEIFPGWNPAAKWAGPLWPLDRPR